MVFLGTKFHGGVKGVHVGMEKSPGSTHVLST
jgi:hypothetical protein